jgi:hypothetical protein
VKCETAHGETKIALQESRLCENIGKSAQVHGITTTQLQLGHNNHLIETFRPAAMIVQGSEVLSNADGS